MEQIKPKYYELKVVNDNGSLVFDVFDLINAIEEKQRTSCQVASALKYIIRLKEETLEKRLNDLDKAIECLKREKERLNRTQFI